jgi:hypothetical protein
MNKIVPIEPTEEMHIAAVKEIQKCTGNDDFPPRVYKAMLSAAPDTDHIIVSRAEYEQMKEQVVYDFGGHLTTRKERLICSSADDASPMVDAIKEFLAKRKG